MKTKPAKSKRLEVTESLAPLTQFDWDFYKVASWELAACCHYEYARESPSIVAHYDEGKNLDRAPHGLFYVATVGETFLALPNPFRWSWLTNFRTKFATTPWQKLPEKFRRTVGQDYEKSKLHSVLSAAFCRADSQFVPPSFLSRGNRRKGIDPETGIERIAVEINWAGFDDEEIHNAFKQWVKTHRPRENNRQEWRPSMPKGFAERIGHRCRQGRDESEEFRKSLDRLGIFRLRRRHTLDEMFALLCQHWPKAPSEQSKYSEISECNREFRKAIRDFHNLFPFLPSHEMPVTLKPRKNPYTRSKPDRQSLPEYHVLR